MADLLAVITPKGSLTSDEDRELERHDACVPDGRSGLHHWVRRMRRRLAACIRRGPVQDFVATAQNPNPQMTWSNLLSGQNVHGCPEATSENPLNPWVTGP